MIIKSIFVPITPSTPSRRTGKDSPELFIYKNLLVLVEYLNR